MTLLSSDAYTEGRTLPAGRLGTIRVIDVVILIKNEDGTVDAAELSDGALRREQDSSTLRAGASSSSPRDACLREMVSYGPVGRLAPADSGRSLCSSEMVEWRHGG
jgi:hypothetical protein